MKGNLIIISSPSGGGKGTLIKAVLQSVQDLAYSVSYTTRACREGEINGVHYFFVSREDFEERVKSGDFLEYFEVHGNMYGTSRSLVEDLVAQGKDVILEIDVQGAAVIRRKMPDAVSIFILPPAFEVLRERLTTRATEGTEDLSIRLRNAFDEVKEYTRFGYVIINDEVGSAVERLESVILAERQRPDRQMDQIRAILYSFDKAKL